MLGFSLGVDAPIRRSPVDWWPSGVAAALDFRRGLYALPDVADISTATEAELQSLRPAQFPEMLTVSRATPATYVDAAGQIRTAAANQPRFDWTHGARQLLVERAAANLFVDPFNPATQTVTVADSDDYTISVRGAGSVTVSGAASGVATHGAALNVKTSGTSLTCTVSGPLDAVQVEHMHRNDMHPLEWGSSFIDGVRAADHYAFRQEIVDLYNRAECTILAQFGYVVDHFSVKTIVDVDGSALLGYRRDSQSNYRVGPGPTLNRGPVAQTNEPKAVLGAWSATDRALGGVDGAGGVAFDTDLSGAPAAATTLRLGYSGNEAFMPCLWCDAVYVWPRRLTDTEIQAVTRPYGA